MPRVITRGVGEFIRSEASRAGVKLTGGRSKKGGSRRASSRGAGRSSGT